MGQKVNPIGLRLGYSVKSFSQWNSYKQIGSLLHQDFIIREYLESFLIQKGYLTGRIEIIRQIKKLKIQTNLFQISSELELKELSLEIQMNIKKIAHCEIDWKYNLIKEINEITDALLFANYCKYKIQTSISNFNHIKEDLLSIATHVKGIRIRISGRLNGVTMARFEEYQEGELSLQRIDTNIDYALVHALTIYGIFGIKVWIKGKKI